MKCEQCGNREGENNMNGFAVERLIDTLKSIDEKLGRIADALEKCVGKDVDLSGVLDEVIAAEKGEPKPVVEEWDDERILEQFKDLCLRNDKYSLFSMRSTVTKIRRTSISGLVELCLLDIATNTAYTVSYDYINNRIVM